MQPVGTSQGSGQCMGPDAAGQLVPCTDPVFGWLGSDGCYYQADPSFVPPAWDTADQHPGQPGAFYLVTCMGMTQGTGGGIVWLAAGTAPAPVASPPAPGVLAQQAESQLALSATSIEASPSTTSDQLVDLPTWVWVPAALWHPLSATATVPGESATATATPTSVTWSFGDGTTLVCDGPGTPYAAGGNPAASSPTCGHTYTTSSASEPGGAFPVAATVAWTVTWTGGGQTGTLPALVTTAHAAFRVAEGEAIDVPPAQGS